MRLILIIILAVWSLAGNAQEMQTPPVPVNLKATLFQKNGRNMVRLQWDDKAATDSVTYGYFVYTNFPPGKSLYKNGKISLLKDAFLEYELKKPVASDYIFAVTAVSAFPESVESQRSDTVTVQSVSRKLPLVKVKSYKFSGNTLSVYFAYPEIADLDHFKIYVNDKEQDMKVDPGKRVADIPFDNEKKNQHVRIVAVSRTGVKSAMPAFYMIK